MIATAGQEQRMWSLGHRGCAVARSSGCAADRVKARDASAHSSARWPILLAGIILCALPGLAQEPSGRQATLVVTERTRQLLVEELASDDVADRSRALDALRQLGEARTSETIRSLVDAPEAALRADAVAAMEAVLSAEQLLPVLRKACNDPSDRVARQALRVLSGTPGSAAYEALLNIGPELRQQRERWWVRALVSRAETPPATVMENLLAHRDRAVRTAGAALLARHPSVVTIQRRIELLGDSDPMIRAIVVESLGGDLGQSAARSAVLSALEDRSPYVRRASLKVLEAAPPALQRVAPLSRDDDSTVRRAAVVVAARIGGGDAMEILAERLADPEILVARAAGAALANFQGDEADKLLIALLSDEPDQVVIEAARALGLREQGAAVDALIALLEHSSDAIRSAAYEALGRIGDRRVVAEILLGAVIEPPPARVAMNDALGHLGDVRALKHLMDELQYGTLPPGDPPYTAEETAVAAAAVRALGRIADAQAASEVIRFAGDWHRNPGFWRDAAECLGELGDPKAAGILAQMGIAGIIIFPNGRSLEAPDDVRIAALRSIAKLNLRELAQPILEMTPPRCSLPVRKTAAEVLTALTGRKHAHRSPGRIPQFALTDLGVHESSALNHPICYPVQE